MYIKYKIQFLVLILVQNCEPKEFCEAFVENNNQIDYGFHQIKAIDSESVSFLFIDNHYWDLHFGHSLYDKEKSLTLFPTDSRQSKHWFGNQYSMAFCLWHPMEQTCAFGLINKQKTLVDFRQRVGHSGQEHRIKEYKKLNETDIDFYNFNPSIGFVPNREQYKKKLVVFVQQMPNSYIESKLYEFDDQFHGHYVQNMTLQELVEPKAIKQLDPKLSIISISGQSSWKHSQNNTALRVYERVYGILILFKFEKVIKYCWTQDMTLNDNCAIDKLKTLINCSLYSSNVSHFESNFEQLAEEYVDKHQSDDNAVNYVISFGVLFIIIVAVVLISGLIYWRSKNEINESAIDLDPIVANEELPQSAPPSAPPSTPQPSDQSQDRPRF